MEFEYREFIGEKKLNDNILKSVKREIDLLIFIMNALLKFFSQYPILYKI